MLLTGIEKLRFVVTFLFFAYVCIFICGYNLGTIMANDDQRWIDELTYDEYDDLLRIMEKYPISDTSVVNTLIYIFDISLGGGLFLLMIKLWSVQNISNKRKEELNYVTLKQQIIGTTDTQVNCKKCNKNFTFKRNVGISTYIQCPFCLYEDTFDDKKDSLSKQKITICWNCKHEFSYIPNPYGIKQVTCPQCGQIGIIPKGS